MEIHTNEKGIELQYQDLSYTVEEIKKNKVVLKSYDGEKIEQEIHAQSDFGVYFLFPQTTIKVKIIPSEEL